MWLYYIDLIHSSVARHWGYLQVFATLSSAAMNILLRLVVNTCQTFSRKYPEQTGKLHDCNITRLCSPKWLTFYQQWQKHIPPNTWFIRFNFYNPMSVNGISLVLICIFLITPGIELLFLCLLVIHVSSSVKCLFCLYCLVSNEVIFFISYWPVGVLELFRIVIGAAICSLSLWFISSMSIWCLLKRHSYFLK